MNRLMKRDATIQYNCVAEEITPVEVSMTLFRCEANELPPLAVARARIAFPGANVIWGEMDSVLHENARYAVLHMSNGVYQFYMRVPMAYGDSYWARIGFATALIEG